RRPADSCRWRLWQVPQTEGQRGHECPDLLTLRLLKREGNHRMGDVPLNELICRLIFLIRHLKVDTVVCWDPWAHDEENPDHVAIARGIEAACWMAGRPHDYPEQLAAGLAPHAVTQKYYYARRPEINRYVDVSGVLDQMIDANRANRAKG